MKLDHISCRDDDPQCAHALVLSRSQFSLHTSDEALAVLLDLLPLLALVEFPQFEVVQGGPVGAAQVAGDAGAEGREDGDFL